MLDEYAALVKAVVIEPRDLVPRLVLADWLDEHDRDVEADLIRAEDPGPLAGMVPGLRFPFVRGRAAVLVSPDGRVRADLQSRFAPTYPRRYGTIADVRHGFVEGLACSRNHLDKFGAAWVAANPIRYVLLVDRPWPSSVILRTPYSSWWCWESWQEGVLPGELFAGLTGYAEEAISDDCTHRCYRSVVDAHQALSLAAVNLARKRAGLPPLRPAPPSRR